MIKIIRGVYGYVDESGAVQPKTVKDDPFSLDKEKEARLVDQGVAVYVGDSEAEAPEAEAPEAEAPEAEAETEVKAEAEEKKETSTKKSSKTSSKKKTSAKSEESEEEPPSLSAADPE